MSKERKSVTNMNEKSDEIQGLHLWSNKSNEGITNVLNTIKSSNDAMITAYICNHGSFEKRTIFEIFSQIKVERKRKVTFLAPIDLWKNGLLLKRYLEIPIDSLENVFEEIDYYIQDGAYVIYKPTDSLYNLDGILICDVDSAKKEVVYQTVSMEGVVRNTLSWDEFAELFFKSLDSKNMVGFDVFSVIEQKKSEEVSLKQKISKWNMFHLINVGRNDRKNAFQVFREWYEIQLRCSEFLSERTRGILERSEGLFEQKEKISRKGICKIIGIYNQESKLEDSKR